MEPQKNQTVKNKTIIVKCSECPKEFEKNSYNQLTCSKECRAIRDRRVKRERYSTDPEYRQKELTRTKPLYNSEKYKKQYAEDYNGMRTRQRMRRKIVTVGTEIKNIALNQKGWGTKSLWHGRGYWSKKYDACEECHTTIYRYGANGLCARCYEKFRTEALDKEGKLRKKFLKMKNKQKYSQRATSKRKDALKWINKAQEGLLNDDSRVLNLLNNLSST